MAEQSSILSVLVKDRQEAFATLSDKVQSIKAAAQYKSTSPEYKSIKGVKV